MSFNHYAKIKRILESQHPNWYIVRFDEPTKAQNFKGETIKYDYYYRIYSVDGKPLKYCKFQQLDRLAQTLAIPVEALPVL